MSESKRDNASILVVGGGFAGVACAKALARHGVHVTVVDKHNYHQFQPMLYQVASAQLAPNDVARPLRGIFRKDETVDVKMAEVIAVDPDTKTATGADGTTFSGDYLVLAMGAEPNFFHTPGADRYTFPLYGLSDAERLRSRILQVFEDADRDPTLVRKGALNFVIVGAGATGVETAGALLDVVNRVIGDRYHELQAEIGIFLLDPAPVVLGPFSEKAHKYAASVLETEGVHLKLGLSATQIADDRVLLSDGSEIRTHTVVWAGGIQAAALAAKSGIRQGHGGRLDVRPDLTVEGFERVYALGDVANTLGPDGKPFPQLGSVAMQAGEWAAKNILAEISGKRRTEFHYHDKGIMAMIGRNAAVAEMGAHRHELHGSVAFAAWLGVHALLLSGMRQRTDAFISWGWDYFTSNRAPSVLDRSDATQIDWGDDDDEEILLKPVAAAQASVH